MHTSAVLTFAAGLLGGLLLIARLSGWAVALWSSTRTVSRLSWAPLLLHSGPWLLVLAAASVFFAFSRPDILPPYALLTGVGVAVGVQALAIAFALATRQWAQWASTPLTPERLRTHRRVIYTLLTSLFAGTEFILTLWLTWPLPRQHPLFTVIIAAACVAVGLAFAWFFWQWHKGALEGLESARKRAGRTTSAA